MRDKRRMTDSTPAMRRQQQAGDWRHDDTRWADEVLPLTDERPKERKPRQWPDQPNGSVPDLLTAVGPGPTCVVCDSAHPVQQVACGACGGIGWSPCQSVPSPPPLIEEAMHVEVFMDS
ncbi:hypothetical protein VDGL01_03030 [Verticillium dahliae]